MSSLLAQLLFEAEVSIASLGIKADADSDLICHNENLTSLAGAPLHVGGDFDCYNNNLTSLAGAPEHVGRDFLCHNNQLSSLAGAPLHVGGDFECDAGIALASIPLMHIGGKVNTIDDKLDEIINKHLNQGRRGCLALQQELIDAGYDVEAELIL